MTWLALSIESPSAVLLGIAACIASLGGILSTVLASHRIRDEERAACEDKLRGMRIEAGQLADELYQLKRKEII